MHQEIQYCEFFAGKANAFRSVSNTGYPSCAVDISYFDGISGTTSNPFDILSASGLALGPEVLHVLVCQCVYMAK